MPRIIPEGSLDDDQRKHLLELRENPTKSFWISGFPGSGKTVLLYYSIKELQKEETKVSFTTFTHTLLQLFESITQELGLAEITYETIYSFLKKALDTNTLVCDEVQDFSFKMINGIKSKNIRVIAAGDGNQSIYDKDPYFNDIVPPVSQIQTLLQTKVLNLNINHRLPTAILKGINSIMSSNKIWPGANSSRIGNLIYFKGQNIQDEINFVVDDAIEKSQKSGKKVAFLFREHRDMKLFVKEYLTLKNLDQYREKNFSYSLYNEFLSEKNVPFHFIVNDNGDLTRAEKDRKIILMTIHGSKGLDFDAVYIPLFNSRYPDIDDTLLMVAMSRSNNDLIFSYHGTPHQKLYKLITDNLCQQMIKFNSNNSDNTIITDF